MAHGLKRKCRPIKSTISLKQADENAQVYSLQHDAAEGGGRPIPPPATPTHRDQIGPRPSPPITSTAWSSRSATAQRPCALRRGHRQALVRVRARFHARPPLTTLSAFFRNVPKPGACSYNTVIDGLCRRGRLPEARHLFAEMIANGIAPTVVTYTTVIHSLSREACFGDALKMFDEMARRGIMSNVVTYSSLINGLSKGGRAASAPELLDRMVKERDLPNAITYRSVIDGLYKEGQLSEAMEVLDRMRLQGRKHDAGLFGKWISTAVVTALCAKDEVGRAFRVYQSMRTRGISTEPRTFHLPVQCFSKKNNLEKAAHVVLDMLSERCIPERETWDAIVRGYWSKKVRQEAEEMTKCGAN
ncbi:hypothetical protein ABZP36_024522 [Zizania latifolia]